MPSPRRINDAQTERLLASLQDLSYRQKLAHKIAEKENVRYASAMRRLQRYATKAGEKRSFARAPIPIRRQVVKQARDLPIPVSVPLPTPKPRPAPKQLDLPRPTFFREIPPSGLPTAYRGSDDLDRPDNYEYRAILAYFDGDAEEAARILQQFGAPSRTAEILELVAKSVDVMGMRNIGRLSDAVMDWRDTLESDDIDDIRDFSDLLLQGSFPEWMQEIMLEDLMESDSTFAEWMDAWRNDNMIFRVRGELGYEDVEDSEFWKLWRAAYARAKK